MCVGVSVWLGWSGIRVAGLSSGACDYSVELPHWSYCSWFDVCWSFSVVGLEWYTCCRVFQPTTRIPLQPNHIKTQACNTDTTPTQPNRNSDTHRTKKNTTDVVIQQNSRKLLIMDILMSETCWAHKKWNKTASDIKLVFYSSTITMMHGPINIRNELCFFSSVRERYAVAVDIKMSDCKHGLWSVLWRKTELIYWSLVWKLVL